MIPAMSSLPYQNPTTRRPGLVVTGHPLAKDGGRLMEIHNLVDLWVMESRVVLVLHTFAATRGATVARVFWLNSPHLRRTSTIFSRVANDCEQLNVFVRGQQCLWPFRRRTRRGYLNLGCNFTCWFCGVLPVEGILICVFFDGVFEEGNENYPKFWRRNCSNIHHRRDSMLQRWDYKRPCQRVVVA